MAQDKENQQFDTMGKNTKKAVDLPVWSYHYSFFEWLSCDLNVFSIHFFFFFLQFCEL